MQPLAVEGLFNVRAALGATPWIVRSGAPEGLREPGAQALRDLGVSVIIDLREASEAGIARHSIPVRTVPIW